jgi:hypothetical protein
MALDFEATEPVPDARLVVIGERGHFAYLECAGEVRNASIDFFELERVGARPNPNGTGAAFEVLHRDTGRSRALGAGLRRKQLRHPLAPLR